MFGVSDDAPVAKEPTLDEINLKIPRRVRLSYNGRTSAWVILICLGGGLIFMGGLTWYLIHQKQQHDALQREGLEAPAEVTYISHGRGSTVHYTFRVAGEDYRNHADYSKTPRRLAVGSTITVLYLPSNPTVNYPKDWGWLDFGDLILFYFGALPACAGAYTAWNLVRDWRLARHGWVTEGKVTPCVPKKNTGHFMVDYEFHTQTDFRTQKEEELIEGSDNDCHDEYKTDAKIKVIYLRHHPKRSSSYPIPTCEMVEHKSPNGPFMTER